MNNRAEPNLLLLESNYFINGRSRTGIKSLSAYVSGLSGRCAAGAARIFILAFGSQLARLTLFSTSSYCSTYCLVPVVHPFTRFAGASPQGDAWGECGLRLTSLTINPDVQYQGRNGITAIAPVTH